VRKGKTMEMDTRGRIGTMQRQIAGGGDTEEKSFVSEVTGMLGSELTAGELDLVLECYRRRLPSVFSLREIFKTRGIPWV
jgi:hypothetical protein